MATITPTPVPAFSGMLPDPADRTTYGARGRAMWLWETSDLVPGANQLAADTYSNAIEAQSAAQAAQAIANFKGDWDTLSGALARPASVSWWDPDAPSEKVFWVLLADLPNVATEQPGVSAYWAKVGISNAYGIAYGGTTVGDALDTLATSMPRFAAADALPGTDIGAIWHDGYAAVMLWQTIGAYTGYASVNVGQVAAFDGTYLPPGWVTPNTSIAAAGYAALRAYSGLTTTRDLRGVVLRALDESRGLDPSRVLGSYQADGIKQSTFGIRQAQDARIGGWNPQGEFSVVDNDNTGSIGKLNSTAGSGTSFTRIVLGSATETRVKNIALPYRIKY